ncbi:MAG: ABC transporter permease [Bacteroidales bacterium]|nr:ABC transporter permease [Bacteroidales bacterium]MCF8344419.1 ABC transporter permease [Bacteroidales bacterium]MCF8351208.1 ABC transporter permease [Bacteroidales bacterium]MCF8377661.1 ABC transporter permease [Bacteroidales bacterium]MCF8402061.1 ABC transporter permease [Bacteroidales bacterium]
MSYFRFIWKSNSGFTFFSMVFIALFQVMILYLVTTFDTQAMLKSVLEQMPPRLKIFLDDAFFSTLTFDGAAAFGFNHPIVLALLAIVAITIPVKHISREIESGTMELMLSQPFSRKSLVWKLWLSACVILGMIILVASLSSILAVQIFHQLHVDVLIKIIYISLNIFLLFILVMTYTLFAAVSTKGGGFSGSLSAMITLILYLLFFVGKLWDPMEVTLHFNIFNYYQPQNIMLGNGSIFRDTGILTGLTIILLVLSWHRFDRRDIP